ncbi:MAG: hypothetical protein D6675_08720 [Gemmatimonadetes bacterium]|nr:MAG: hypothetical protein D6675_08720 [Gemmatimonadota bacterium]
MGDIDFGASSIVAFTVHGMDCHYSISSNELYSMIIVFLGLLYLGVWIMIFNLIVHLTFRGFWIGIIGLGSVYPDGIQYDRLKYNAKFTRYLKNKIPSLESLALNLDKISSSIFSFTFLIFFMFMSIGVFIAVLVAFNLIITTIINIFSLKAIVFAGLSLGRILAALANLALILFIVGGLLSVVDFLFQGIFKRIPWRWFAVPYFHLSRFYRIISLAFIYEAIYYSLISNLSKKVVGVILIGYLLVIFSVFNFSYSEFIYYPSLGDETTPSVMSKRHYQNFLPNDIPYLLIHPVIQSNIIRDEPVQLFIPYLVSDNDSLKARCPDAQPFRELGFNSKSKFNIGGKKGEQTGLTISTNLPSHGIENTAMVLDCLANFYTISVDDSIYTNLPFTFFKHPNHNEPGILTYIPTHQMPKGYHILAVKANRADATPSYISFWLQ